MSCKESGFGCIHKGDGDKRNYGRGTHSIFCSQGNRTGVINSKAALQRTEYKRERERERERERDFVLDVQVR